MRFSMTNPRTRAAVAATLLFGLGALVGVAADRWWSFRTLSELEAAPLTAAAMADALDLDSAQQARVAALLESLQASVVHAAQEGPASLQAAARDARRRLEEGLPPDRRERFRSWMSGHHERMMEHMCDDDMMGSRMHREGSSTRKRRCEN